MNTENLSTLKIHKLTQAQYEREREAGRLDENALYLTPDSDYVLPIATETILGGVKASTRTEDMTQAVGVDENGGLWTYPSADIGDIEAALDVIIAIQNELIGGDAE